MKHPGELRQTLEDLRSGRLPASSLYAVLHTFGNEGFLEAKSDVEGFLRHADPQLRAIALNVLALHWMCRDHRSTCEQFALRDPDEDNRRLGVTALGVLLQRTRDPDALKLLLDVFHNPDNRWDIRDAAYGAILDVLGAPTDEQISLHSYIIAARALLEEREERDAFAENVNWDRIREAEEVAKRR